MLRTLTLGVLAGVLAAASPAGAGERVDFVRQVQPIFQAHCYECHGPQKQKSGLRLDSRELTFKGGKSGPAIVPGKLDDSYLFDRIKGDSDDGPMPPKGRHNPLTKEQVALIGRWIEQGAVWPDSANNAQAKIEKHWSFVRPVKPALPPVRLKDWVRNPIDAFVLARLEKEGLRPSPEAPREVLVRRVYLDLVGLPPSPEEVDAFVNDPSPGAYEALVEKLLASPHFGERWARPWMDLGRYADTNGYEKDGRRSNWLWRDWVIQALNADMPYDQFVTRQIAGDLLPDATDADRIATGFQRNSMKNEEGGVDQAEQRWLVDVDRLDVTGQVFLGLTVGCAQCHDHKFDPISQKEFYSMLAFFEHSDEPKLGIARPGEEKAHALLEERLKGNESLLAAMDQNFEQSYQSWVREQSRLLATDRANEKKYDQAKKANPKAKIAKPVKLSQLPEGLRYALDQAPEKLQAGDRKALRDYFRNLCPETRVVLEVVNGLKRQLESKENSTLVLQEKTGGEAESFIRLKGAFLNKGEKVTAAVPAAFGAWRKPWPKNRLGLADWIVDRDNPLAARVEVNRLWEAYFGKGLVETSEDFGMQGTPPTHPKLLDWLACELVERGWSRKAIHRLIVLSATYRQDSCVSPELLEKDRYNDLLARGPRFRMEAEMIRDTALTASGLLSEKIGGPSVMPYQPDGVWNVPYSGDRWVTSKGAERFRRGLYVFWRRSAPYPAMESFDATSREQCTVRRIRTNTPLQAMVTLNDPGFFEMAQALAKRACAAGNDEATRAAYAMRLAVGRHPEQREVQMLVGLYHRQLALFGKSPAEAKKVAGTDKGNVAEMAAWTMVANTVLNLDETLTKE